MNNEKIGKLIKKIRIKNNLTQKQLAEELNVTYQAVSKWENGKNIPDIEILTILCNKYNIDIDSFLKGKYKKNKGIFKKILLPIFVIIIVISLLFLFKNNNNTFSLNPINSACENFNVSGSIAYDNKKTSIYISNIENCTNDSKTYVSFKCTLFENDNNKKIKIGSYTSSNKNTIEGYLKNLTFNIEDYKRECKNYKDANLELEIKLTENSGNIVSYYVPLKIDSKC